MWNYPPAQILVPVDFGEASRRAVQVAGTLARRFHAGLQALHVEAVEAPAYFTHEQIAVLERELRVARAAADRHVSAFVGPLVDVLFSARVVDGAPATAILEAVRSADLAVMGTHGRRGPSRWWLGSVAERVVSETPTPLLVVRAAGEDETVEAIFERPLVVAGSQFDDEGVRYAIGLAQAFGGEIAPGAPTCEADIARERHATLMVIPGQSSAGYGFRESAERLLRNCTLPMLFVPGRG
jgi:nucleotide-binding universal stress UspA family protein